METSKMIQVVLRAAAQEIIMAEQHIDKVKGMGCDQTLGIILEDGHMEEIRIHQERAVELIKVAQTLAQKT